VLHRRIGADASRADDEDAVAPELLHHAGADDVHTRLAGGRVRAVVDAVRRAGDRTGRRVVRIGWTRDGEPIQPQRDVRRAELDARSRHRGARHVGDELTIFDDDFRHGDGAADVLGRGRAPRTQQETTERTQAWRSARIS